VTPARAACVELLTAIRNVRSDPSPENLRKLGVQAGGLMQIAVRLEDELERELERNRAVAS